MRFHYDLTQAEPIIRDMPVYDATSLAQGELLMLGATANNTADGGISLITAFGSTAASHAVDAVGILNENTYESTAPTRTVDDTSGVYLGKVIINPLAVYLAQVDGSTGDDIAIESSSTTTSILEDVSSGGANSLDGYFIMMVNCATDGLEGDIRMITANTVTACTVAALSATPTTSDNYIFANPMNAYAGDLNDEATGLSCGYTLDAPEGATNIRVLLSYAQQKGGPLFPLRQYADAGTQNLGEDAKLYSDIMLKDHLYGVQE